MTAYHAMRSSEFALKLRPRAVAAEHEIDHFEAKVGDPHLDVTDSEAGTLIPLGGAMIAQVSGGDLEKIGYAVASRLKFGTLYPDVRHSDPDNTA